MARAKAQTEAPLSDEAARAAILDVALRHVPFDGFTPLMLSGAAKEAGVKPDAALRAFPGGPKDLVRYWHTQLDQQVFSALQAKDLSKLKIRARVTLGARLRIEAMTAHKIAARRAAAFLATPFYAPLGAELGWASADAIWRGIGDSSTDFNYYSKRLLLQGVLAATALYWFNDESDGAEASWTFLDARIANVMEIEKLKAGAQGLLERLPDPLGLLARLRYPSGGR